MHSNCILDSDANLFVRHMVFVGNVQKSPIASHLKGMLCMSLKSGICLQYSHFHYKLCIIFDQLLSFCIDQSLSLVDGLKSVI